MANNNIGPKRLVVGAHYGLKDWLVQRLTAIIMALYTVILLAKFLMANDFSYVGWAGMFAQQWFKLATFAVLMSLFYHAWIGIRDISMDYVKPLVLRLTLQVAAVLWLIGCAGWTVQILWRV
ncbi:succinate dehydrogenase, hydrophobic membrane anchor protein [Solimicrobium silvestre]|uniref:Succinate dehydrogenase hydrophobic membrane anchor subunit n=1 Tax=Solimicrobium silvestre TaxID=2099400 RepID=A0A2S9GWT2_9BURK|nr:succinate dehydrogenase, hydrophobic membrane anchor protein [Solimicrobium silvestre]PRC92183.1 Succinate dehydrogenase, hydrophobic membrane anchor protein [Solimicrobium silvestre]